MLADAPAGGWETHVLANGFLFILLRIAGTPARPVERWEAPGNTATLTHKSYLQHPLSYGREVEFSLREKYSVRMKSCDSQGFRSRNIEREGKAKAGGACSLCRLAREQPGIEMLHMFKLGGTNSSAAFLWFKRFTSSFGRRYLHSHVQPEQTFREFKSGAHDQLTFRGENAEGSRELHHLARIYTRMPYGRPSSSSHVCYHWVVRHLHERICPALVFRNSRC